MKDDIREYIALSEEILSMLDGEISPEQFKLLESKLREDNRTKQFYIEFIRLCASLRQYGEEIDTPVFKRCWLSKDTEDDFGPEEEAAAEDVLSSSLDDSAILREVLERDMQDSACRRALEQQRQEEGVVKDDADNILGLNKGHSNTRPTGAQILHAMMKIAVVVVVAVVLSLLDRMVFRQPAAIAKLTGGMNIVWNDAGLPVDVPGKLWAGDMYLKEGFAQITFADGAEVLLQAPVKVRLESAGQILLEQGRLTSKVPRRARGFVVRTPDATVVDYGTEFGVHVDKTGQMETEVFKGTVELRLGSNPLVFEKASRLTVGQYGKVVNHIMESGVVDKDAKQLYVRNMLQIRNRKYLLGHNLIRNGNFEAGAAGKFDIKSYQPTDVQIPGWNDNTAATMFRYEDKGNEGYPRIGSDVLPPERGQKYFVGSKPCKIYQDKSVAVLSWEIDKGKIKYDLSGWLGGFGAQKDTPELIVEFMNGYGVVLAKAQLGPVSPAQRNYKTGFVKLQTKGSLPRGTRRIHIILRSIEYTGVTDAYADNLSLVLNEK